MSNDVEEGQGTSLSIEDPVDKETLGQLRELREAREVLLEENLSLDQRKVQVLAAIQRLAKETSLVFDRILLERGLPADSVVEIHQSTGRISLRRTEDV